MAAINAAHINTSAIISIIIVPKNVPMVPKILLRPSPVPPHPTHPIVHSKVISISFAIVTTVFFPSVEVAILFPGLPKRVNCPLLVVAWFCGVIITERTISPNDNVSAIIAGTKQSHINSLILNVSSQSHIFPISSLPATKCRVKRGENMA